MRGKENTEQGEPDREQHLAVLLQIAQLQSMSLEQLRDKWYDLNGRRPPKYKKQFLMHRLAFRIQEIYFGGLSKEAKAVLEKAAKKDPLATLNTTIPRLRTDKKSVESGTRFVRIWKNKRCEVIALEKGFSYNNRYYRSLSAVAKAITGKKWNGNVFFGLRKYQGYEEHHNR